MHHTNIRALALALAAVLCLLLVPAAAADYEPWTYEVDDQMGSYGVDYYGDVGFNDPRAGRSTTGSTGTHSTTTSGISTYSAEGAGSAAAAYADENAETESEQNTVTLDNAYTVTIPAEVTVTDGTPAELAVTGKLEKHCKLTIDVESDSNYQLKCTDNDQYYIGYTLTGFPTTEKQFAYETTTDAETISKTLTVTLDENNRNDTVSGNYTDTLKFTFACTLKPYAVIRYESMATTQDVASNSGFGHHPAWEADPQEEELTAETTTFKNKNTGELENWVEESQKVTLQDGQQKYEVDFHRKMYAFDLNVAYWDKTNNKFVQAATTEAEGTMGYEVLQNWGKATIEVNGVDKYGHGVGDYFTGHPKGSEFTFTLVNTGANYTILGYKTDIKSAEFPTNKNDVTPFEATINGTLTAGGAENATPNTKTNVYYTYYLWIFVELNDTSTSSMVGDDVVLPSWDETKPVVIEMPTVDTDTADDTTGTTKDTDTPVDNTPADDPEQDITPDDLMISDGDEMLARMDAAFAVPYLDDPAA